MSQQPVAAPFVGTVDQSGVDGGDGWIAFGLGGAGLALGARSLGGRGRPVLLLAGVLAMAVGLAATTITGRRRAR